MPTEEGDKRNGKTARASEVLSQDEAIRDLGAEKKARGLDYQYQIDQFVKEERAKHITDMEEQKDLDTANRRGLEGGFDYLARREAGMPPKNEYESKDSRYSRSTIEEGLLIRETYNGREYSVMWDKDGELISIQKGDKGTVMSFAPLDKDGVITSRGGIMTHTHPSEYKDRNGKAISRGEETAKYDDRLTRLHGMGFSAADVKNHGFRETLETRAVAREGTYVLRGTEAKLTEGQIRNLPQAIQYEYKNGDSWTRNRVTMAIASAEIKEANTQVMNYGRATLGADYTSSQDRFFNSQHSLAMMGAVQKTILAKYGIEFEFKANKGYEAVGRAIKSGTIEAVRAEAKAGNFKTGSQIVRDIAHPASNGRTPINEKGDTIPAGRTAKGIAAVSTGGDGKPKRVSNPKTPKISDPAPAKTPKVKAVAKPPKSVVVDTGSNTYSIPTSGGLFGGKGLGGFGGGSVSGGSGGFVSGGTFTFGR
jgi:hypothetical protein